MIKVIVKSGLNINRKIPEKLVDIELRYLDDEYN